MTIIALVLFGCAALLGVFLASRRFRDLELPMSAAIAHGVFAAAGLAVLIGAVATGAASGGGARLALAIFVVAALGGFVLFSFHLRRQALPIPLMVVHAGAAVIAFLILLVIMARA